MPKSKKQIGFSEAFRQCLALTDSYEIKGKASIKIILTASEGSVATFERNAKTIKQAEKNNAN